VIVVCTGCGAMKPEPDGSPSDFGPSEHCGDCPPWLCEDCGEMCSLASLCPCWTPVDQLAHADLKAFLAEAGLSLSTPVDQP
jgi:hypothetical protein